MELTLKRLALLACVTASLAARAQFNNSSLSAGPLVNSVIGQGAQYGLALEYDRYLESGFELVARAPVVIAETPVGADTPSGAGRVFGTGLSVGARYLFLEEQLRPWAGLQLTWTILITQPAPVWGLGAGPSLGLDWVFHESFALSLRGSYDVFVELNRPWRHQLSVTLGLVILL
ncbi:MAG: hypothetical protein JNM17_39215 [Archangium sp.]|nr:hypothetical protein [Archangium sp.]